MKGNRHRTKIWLALIVLCSFVVSGCWGAREIEHMIYVNTLGVDLKKGKYIVYAQILSFSNIAKVEAAGGSNPKQIIAVGRGEGDTFDQAIFNLYRTSQQRMEWGHIKAIVFHKRALDEKSVQDLIEELNRYYEFRYTVWTFATDSKMEDVLNTTPLLHISSLYSQLNDPMDMYTQISIIRPMYLYRFIADWTEPGRTVLLPYLSVSDSQWTENKKPQAKQLIGGSCFLYKKKLNGCMPRIKLQGLRWLENTSIRTPLILREGTKQYGIIVMNHFKSKIKVKEVEGEPVFSMKVETSGFLSEYLKQLPERKLNEMASSIIRKQIHDTFREGIRIHTDVYNLESKLYRDNPQLWKKLQKSGGFKLTEKSLDTIDVKATLQNSGLSKFYMMDKKH